MNWLVLRRLWGTSVQAEADAWLTRHGFYAYRLAGDRAIDAYCLGDLQEQERWHEIRAIILDRIAPNATVEEIQILLGPGEGAGGGAELFGTVVDNSSPDSDSYM
jgi:hypothetical protein